METSNINSYPIHLDSTASHTSQLSMDDMPDEILCEIMLHYAQSLREQYTNAPWGDYHNTPYSWLYITHICHRWREVALQCPKLWDWIVPVDPVSTTAFIERSGQCPLTVPSRRIPEQSPPTGFDFGSKLWTGALPSASLAQWAMEQSLQLLYKQFYRIEHLDIPANAPVPIVDGTTAAMLRSVTVRDARIRDTPILSYLNTLPPHSLPALSELHSWCNPARIRNLLRPTLTSLTLSGHSVQYCDKNILLDILEAIPGLVQLRFDHADHVFEEEDFTGDFFSAPATSLSQIPPERSITLSSLQFIHISEQNGGRSAMCMLRHLTLPESVSIEVASYAGLLGVSSEVTDTLLQTVQYLGGAGNPLAMAVRLLNGQDIALQLWSDGPQTTKYVPFSDWGQPRVSYSVRLPELAAADFGLRSFASRVTTLYVDHEMLASAWVRSCADMSQLRRLHIGGTAMYFVADALAAHVSRATARDNRLIPSLETLVLDDVPWNVDLDHVQHDVPSPLTRNLATALRERGGINKVVIRGGKYLSRADMDYLAFTGSATDVDWE